MLSYDGRRIAYVYNYLSYRFTASNKDKEEIDRHVQRNVAAAVPYIVSVEPSPQDVDVLDKTGQLTTRRLHVFNKRFMLQKMAEILTFKAKPDLLINSLQLSRTIFLEGDDK